jgi:hypothetical protein
MPTTCELCDEVTKNKVYCDSCEDGLLENQLNDSPPVIHNLASGAKVMSLSGHSFKFSDGTVAEPQTGFYVNFFTLKRVTKKITTIRGMAVNAINMVLDEKQLNLLEHLSSKADIVLLPFPVLTALREQGVRGTYPNCVAFNATAETQRSAPADKIVDINNWSY